MGTISVRQQERLAVALRNLDEAIGQAALAVRAALDDLEGTKRKSVPKHK